MKKSCLQIGAVQIWYVFRHAFFDARLCYSYYSISMLLNLFKIQIVTEYSTAEVVAASNASVSQCSTVGGQSLSITVPHAYIATDEACRDVFTEAGLIPHTPTSSLLKEVLSVVFFLRGYWVSPSSLVTAGVPLAATTR